jgi:hypothetical protein
LTEIQQAEQQLQEFLARPDVNQSIVKFTAQDQCLLDELCDLQQTYDNLVRDDQTMRTTATKERLKSQAHLLAKLTRIRTPQGDFDNIDLAAQAQGVRPSTLKIYMSTQPREYYRIP